MIQRIQSIFLIIAIACGFSLAYTAADVVAFGQPWLAVGGGFLAAVLGIFSLMSFRNRRLQLKLNSFNLLINALLMGLLFYWLFSVSGGISFPEKGIEPAFPAIALVCLFLANLYTRRDERLVKSVDRLR